MTGENKESYVIFVKTCNKFVINHFFEIQILDRDIGKVSICKLKRSG